MSFLLKNLSFLYAFLSLGTGWDGKQILKVICCVIAHLNFSCYSIARVLLYISILNGN